MRTVEKVFLILILSMPFIEACPQKANIWITYGQSRFLYSPGLEANYFLNKYIGFHTAANTYFHFYDAKRVVNRPGECRFNLYNGNLGIASHLLYKENYKLGITAGLKIYYGPEYHVVHHYSDGGYNMYFYSDKLMITHGVDMGVFYTFKKVSAIVKYDTDRRMLRFGIGISFGKRAL